ncbi:MFS transporter [Rhodobacteraceae bacterium B1Z28]|uniref:MFS transporter n=1 Tax=Ruegeria haliotis TaxID=2747601 RepID=A0ABX2PRY8_9RHOB|nr:MFS transporter [Ruegeria haliotis]NVO56933.1 MFS transporter [Ruegeria haliotis]
MISRDTEYFLLLNVGHFLDHYFILIFATVAALALSEGWGLSYSELLPYGAPGFAAFALCALPSGWLADRWSRDGMMCIFFMGIGFSSILTGFAQNPFQLGAGLLLMGVFASIYHPVGLAIVTGRWRKTGMRLAVNGVWGNLGVGSAALITGLLIDLASWRAAFIVPGLIGIAFTYPYYIVSKKIRQDSTPEEQGVTSHQNIAYGPKWRVLLCVYMITLLGNVIFQSTTVALPEIFDERLTGLADDISETLSLLTSQSATIIGVLAFLVFAAASLAQLVTGFMLDSIGAKPTILLVMAVQISAFLMMPGLQNLAAFAVSLGFMLGVFGQVPINDFLMAKTVSNKARARAFGLRAMVSFLALSTALPMISVIHVNWGFDGLFHILALCSLTILLGSQIFLKTPPRAASDRSIFQR